jgi:hypothetical protein
MKRLFSVLVLGILVSSPRDAAAATINFDFEATAATYFGVGARPGALTTLALSASGLTMTLTRPGSAFDIVENTGGQAGKPASFGLHSLDPFFAETSNTPFIANFSAPIFSASFDFGDYGGDTPDILTVRAFSGLNGTGSLIQTLTGGPNPVLSLVFIGGTSDFPNSVFYDNITVSTTAASAVPEPASLTLVGIGLAGIIRRRLRQSR